MEGSYAMTKYRNQLLCALAPSDLELLDPSIEPVTLALRQIIVVPKTPIEAVIFIESGLSSEVVMSGDHEQIEVGVIGRDGMIGLPLVLGVDRSPHRIFMQIGGHGLLVSASALRTAMATSPTLRDVLLAYAHQFMLQLAQTALANGRFDISIRLARWLLMSSDRMQSVHVPLTHEFLSLMLGVRRAGVTEALHILEAKGLIKTMTGMIHITDQEHLAELASPIFSSLVTELSEMAVMSA